MLRNYASCNGYVQQLVSAGTINFGIGAIGTSSDNVIEGNVVTGNSNGILVTSGARGNIVRGNVATANTPLQESSSFTAATCATPPCGGGDIRYNAPAGTNTIVDNHCLTLVTMLFATMLHAVTNHLVDAVLALILMVGGVTGAQFGARAGQKIRGEHLRLLLGLLVLAVGVRFAVELVIRPEDLFTIRETGVTG